MTAESAPTAAQRRSWTVNVLCLLPVPFVLAPLAVLAAGPPDWARFGLGALGWSLALLLRGPVAALAGRFAPDTAATVVGAASGPLEEGTRLALLLWAVASLEQAVWFGFGWAVVEIGFAVVNGLLTVRLLGRGDDRAREALALLRAQGRGVDTAGPWHAIAERVSATAGHLGFTLLLFASPWAVLVTAPLHTALNLTAVAAARRSLLRAELAIAGFGLAALAAGIALTTAL